MSEPRVTQPPPAPAPAPPVRPGVKQAERPHPLTPFIRGWLVLVAIVLGFARQFLENGSSGGGINTNDLRWIVPFGVAVVLAAAAAGFLSWYFTRFVIDDDELRIETGVVVKRSRRVPFERLQSVDIVQPFAARFFGLAELRLEAGAGGSGIKLRYLSRVDASRLRDYLLTRAHGHSARIADVADSALPSRFTDLGQGDRTLVRVSPQRLIGSFLLTNNWLVTAGFALLIFVITAAFQVAVALPGLIPVVISAVSMIGSRVIAMFNFTVAESGRGVRITRGLTNL